MTVFVAFVIYNAVHMRCITLSVVCPALAHSSTLSHKRRDFRGKIIKQKMCFNFFYNFCLKHFSF